MDPIEFVVESLESIISVSLGGPRGDPDFCNMAAAAHAYAALEKIGRLDPLDEGFREFCEYNPEFIERARKGKTY